MKSLRHRIIVFLCLITLSAGRTQSGVLESEWTLLRDSFELKGTLSVPQNDNKRTAILFISGSGPTDRDGNNPYMKNNSLKGLSDSLALDGYTTLRFDKRGIAASANEVLDESKLSFDTFVSDASGWLTMLEDSFPNFKYVIAGHSQGSLIAILLAQQQAVDGLISLAGSGRPIDQIIHEQLENQMPNLVSESDSITTLIKAGKKVSGINPMLASLYRPSVQPFLGSWMKYDPANEIAQLIIPLLIAQGEKDLQVSVKDATLLHQANSSSTLKKLPEMNHILKDIHGGPAQNQESYNNPNLPVSSGLILTIKKYLKNM